MKTFWGGFLLQVSILITVAEWVAADGQQVQESNVVVDENRDWDKTLVGKNWTEKMNVLRQRRAMAIKNQVGSRRWPNGIIYYAIDPNDFTPEEETKILSGMQVWMKYTCLTFKNQWTINMVMIQNGKGCNSYAGMLGGTQAINLDKNCRTPHTILHELGHAIGLIHEHRRPDRDNYVTINVDNIENGRQLDFKRYGAKGVRDLGIPYDYESIMQYGRNAFSKNGLDTIVPKTPGQVLGQTFQEDLVHLTFKDIQAVNMMYPCDAKCNSQDMHSYMCSYGFIGKDCNCWCPSSLAGVMYDECDLDLFG